MTPCRVLDTRNANGPLGGPALNGSGAQRLFTIAGTCGIPASARSVSANLTVTQQAAAGQPGRLSRERLPTGTTLDQLLGRRDAGEQRDALSGHGRHRLDRRGERFGARRCTSFWTSMAISSERVRVFLPSRPSWPPSPAWARGQAVQGGALPAPLPLFPPDNWWNVDVSAAPLDPNSAAFITWIGATKGLHPDFGGDSSPSPQIYGMPYIVVPGSEPLEPVAFDYVDESDPGAPGRPAGYPIPAEAMTQPKWIEGGYPGNATVGGDKHMLIVDKDNRVLFETWNTRFNTVTQSVGSRFRGGLPARLEPAAARHVDERRRRGPRHPARTHPLRRGLRLRPHPARLPLHRPRHERLRLSRLAPRRLDGRRAAHGDAAQAEGLEGHLGLLRRRPEDLPGHEDVRPHRGRQRHGHVRAGDVRHALEQRRPEPRLREPPRERLRGRPARLEAAARDVARARRRTTR